MATATRLLLVVLLLFAATPAPSLAESFVVGGRKQRWEPNVNYTGWADQQQFHVGDWLEFKYEKGKYDVVQVNQTAYAACDASSPILSYSRGHNFVFQLNQTGRFYFICSRGYCWNGMKVSVLVQAPPASSPAPHASSASAGAAAGVWCAALAASLGWAVVRRLPFRV
ncbi:early nodulin-like protein 19 [Miscanthus floridulus]|uniref:early nodulin-like protein 19 n=1 Tax=Miscanthus floridulus TaxID=154761 RepID=UPI003458B86E